MRLLITGGAGFIGSNLVYHFLGQNDLDLLVNLDALTYSGNVENLDGIKSDSRHVFIKSSIQDETLVLQLLREYDIQAVINLAAETHVDRSIDGPEPFFQTNLIGTLRLAEACRRYWSSLSAHKQKAFRLLHISTDEVFGSLEPSDPPFCETTRYEPRSPYAASKAGSDHLIRAYWHTYGLPTIITNCSNNYGPRQFPEKLIPLMILSALKELPLPVYGDGMQCRDWLHVEDHCRALDLVLRQAKPGESYGIGSGEQSEITNLELVRLLCRLLDRHAPLPNGKSYATQIAHVPDRPGHDRRYAISSARIRSELGWQPRETLLDGLEKTVLWYLKNPSWSASIMQRIPIFDRLGVAKKS